MTTPTLNVPLNLPLAMQGEAYNFLLIATGGTSPYTWGMIATPNAGNWLQLNPFTGQLTGIPGALAAGEVETLVITVTDSVHQTASITVTMQVLSNTSLPYALLITSEHNQKSNFMSLVEVLTSAAGDVTALIESMPQAFDLTGGAVGAQLDIIGQWVGQSRIISNVLFTGFFGFSELGTGLPDGQQLPFGELADASKGGIWYNLNQPISGTTVLTDPQYITILLARIARNQSNGTLSALEQALFDIFGVGAKVVDNGTLSLAITVSTPVTPVDQALVTGLDILPRPAGVSIASITYQP